MMNKTEDSAISLKTDSNGNIQGFDLNQFQYSALGKLILFRFINNRDIKIIITSSGNTTGTGKTMLAICFAKIITRLASDLFERSINWNSDEYAFLNPYDYIDKYESGKPGDVLITDELQRMADRRRSMSDKNLHISDALELLRYKNIATVGTAPGLGKLDSRIPGAFDVWINVIYPGYANVYYLTWHDFDNKLIIKRMKMYGFKESIMWPDLGENHPDYVSLHNKKKEANIIDLEESENPDEVRREEKTNAVINLIKLKQNNVIDLTQAEIGDVVGYSQQNVAKIKREHF